MWSYFLIFYRTTGGTYQHSRSIVHFNELFTEWNFLNIKGYTRETKLAGHVHATKLKLNITSRAKSEHL